MATGHRVWSGLEERVWVVVGWGWNELGCRWFRIGVEQIRMVFGNV